MQKKSKKEKSKILRIAHYNILSGGENRLKKIFSVISKINPDICGILEAVGWQNDLENFKNLADKNGYKFFYLAIANSKYNIAILSKVSIKIKSIKKGFKHVVLQIIVNEGKHKGINIFFVHLSPVSEDDRIKEIDKLLTYCIKFPKSIIMGDFNSLSPHDPYNRKELFSFFSKNNIIKYGTKRLHFDVIKKIEEAGWVDTMNYLKEPFTFSVPTPSNKDLNHAAKIRVDYAFISKNLLKDLHKAKIFKNVTTDKASDHYPFFIELK